MRLEELWLSWSDAWLTVVTAAGIYVAMIVFSRLWGQRQFATSSSYDLAFVFALGSLIGRVVLVRTTLAVALLGLFTMFALHAATGWLHHHVAVIHRLVQNRPILLVAGSTVLEDNLRRAHTSELELFQQLRLAGRGSLDDVEVVILERNGAFSVIGHDEPIDAELFQEVVGRERLPAGS